MALSIQTRCHRCGDCRSHLRRVSVDGARRGVGDMMKRLGLILIVLLWVTPAVAGIYNNSGTSPEDSLSVKLFVLDSLGNRVALDSTTADNTVNDWGWIEVAYPDGTQAATDSFAISQRNTGKLKYTAGVYGQSATYTYRKPISDLDGGGLNGTYSYVVTVRDTSLKLGTVCKVGEFQLYTTNNISAKWDSTTQIPDNEITNAAFAANAISATTIAGNAIDADAVAANTIGASQIADDAIDAGAIATGAIGTPEFAAEADNIGINWADITNATATQDLSATTISVLQGIASVSGTVTANATVTAINSGVIDSADFALDARKMIAIRADSGTAKTVGAINSGVIDSADFAADAKKMIAIRADSGTAKTVGAINSGVIDSIDFAADAKKMIAIRADSGTAKTVGAINSGVIDSLDFAADAKKMIAIRADSGTAKTVGAINSGVLDSVDLAADTRTLLRFAPWEADTNNAKWNDNLGKFGEWNAQAQTGGTATISAANMGSIADSVWWKNIARAGEVGHAGSDSSVGWTLRVRIADSMEEASQTAASSLDSATVARIVGRKVWGVAAGTAGSTDSTAMTARYVRRLAELDEDNTTLDLDATTIGAVINAKWSALNYDIPLGNALFYLVTGQANPILRGGNLVPNPSFEMSIGGGGANGLEYVTNFGANDLVGSVNLSDGAVNDTLGYWDCDSCGASGAIRFAQTAGSHWGRQSLYISPNVDNQRINVNSSYFPLDSGMTYLMGIWAQFDVTDDPDTCYLGLHDTTGSLNNAPAFKKLMLTPYVLATYGHAGFRLYQTTYTHLASSQPGRLVIYGRYNDTGTPIHKFDDAFVIPLSDTLLLAGALVASTDSINAILDTLQLYDDAGRFQADIQEILDTLQVYDNAGQFQSEVWAILDSIQQHAPHDDNWGATSSASGSGPLADTVWAIDTSGTDEAVPNVSISLRNASGTQLASITTNGSGWEIANIPQSTAITYTGFLPGYTWGTRTLTSESGTTDTDTLFGYNITISAPSAMNLARIYSYEYGDPDSIGGVVVTATLIPPLDSTGVPFDTSTGVAYGWGQVIKAESNASGYWAIDLPPNDYISPFGSKWEFRATFRSGRAWGPIRVSVTGTATNCLINEAGLGSCP